MKQELNRLEQLEVILMVQYADWEAPIVKVIKTDGCIRICGDSKVTVNKASKFESSFT